MGLFTRARKAAVVCGAALALGLSGQAAASAAESDGVVAASTPVVSIEAYCGPTGNIKDPTRNGTIYTMVLTETGRNRHYYDAYGPTGYFKSTGNYCP